MSLTSIKLRKIFTPSKKKGLNCYFGSKFSNQRNISSPKEANQLNTNKISCKNKQYFES